jgi:hypothetical protein
VEARRQLLFTWSLECVPAPRPTCCRANRNILVLYYYAARSKLIDEMEINLTSI